MNRPIFSALVSLALLAGMAASNAARAQGAAPAEPPQLSWPFSGPLGSYDPGQLQRGFKIYREVCSTCHSLKLLSFRNLAEPGGPDFTAAQAKAVAAEYKVNTLNEQGEVVQRPAQLADHFPAPFPNEAAAKAAFGGTEPPDMSTLAKARTYERGFPRFVFDMFTQYTQEGPDYIAALLKGYQDTPQGFTLPQGTFYNVYFPGRAIKMPPPLKDGQMKYDDGSPETLEQYSKDVAAFLMWASEPHLDARKRIGAQVMLYLIIVAGLLYFTKKRVWRDVALHPEKLAEKS